MVIRRRRRWVLLLPPLVRLFTQPIPTTEGLGLGFKVLRLNVGLKLRICLRFRGLWVILNITLNPKPVLGFMGTLHTTLNTTLNPKP